MIDLLFDMRLIDHTWRGKLTPDTEVIVWHLKYLQDPNADTVSMGPQLVTLGSES